MTKWGEYSKEQADADIAAHAALPTVHQDAPALIATHKGDALAHHTKYTDAEAQAIADAQIATHAADYGLHKKIVRKTADQTVTNSTTLVDDDELLLAVAALEVWELFFYIRQNSGTTPDIKFAITVPSAATIEIVHHTLIGVSSITLLVNGSLIPVAEATAIPFSGLAADVVDLLWALYVGGANAGNIQLQWAQNTQDVSDTKVLANSYIVATKIA